MLVVSLAAFCCNFSLPLLTLSFFLSSKTVYPLKHVLGLFRLSPPFPDGQHQSCLRELCRQDHVTVRSPLGFPFSQQPGLGRARKACQAISTAALGDLVPRDSRHLHFCPWGSLACRSIQGPVTSPAHSQHSPESTSAGEAQMAGPNNKVSTSLSQRHVSPQLICHVIGSLGGSGHFPPWPAPPLQL